MNARISQLFSKLRSIVVKEDGQDVVEYALVLGLIACGSLATISAIGTKVATVFSSINTNL